MLDPEAIESIRRILPALRERLADAFSEAVDTVGEMNDDTLESLCIINAAADQEPDALLEIREMSDGAMMMLCLMAIVGTYQVILDVHDAREPP